jgi:hypothetical protein
MYFAVNAMAATEVSGVFSGPQIERTAQENFAVRVLCADTYPGRDTLRTFRRKNAPLLQRGLRPGSGTGRPLRRVRSRRYRGRDRGHGKS